MKSAKFWLAVLVAGIVANILDVIVQAHVLQGLYYSKMTDVMKADTNIGWFVFGDFVAVLVLAWVYDKAWSVFGGGLKGGAIAGFYLGVLASFPAHHFVFLMFKSYPYGLAWVSTIYGILWYVIAGTILAAVMKKGVAAPATVQAG
jgi:hypothetical protein